MNTNQVQLRGFSNPDSEKLYKEQWPEEPLVAEAYEEGQQCYACRSYGKFNADWGICLQAHGRHFTETVFEHFTCPCFLQPGQEDDDIRHKSTRR